MLDGAGEVCMFMGMEKHTITDGTSRMSFELVARNGQKLLGDDGLELIVRLTDEPMHVGGYYDAGKVEYKSQRVARELWTRWIKRGWKVAK